MLSILIPIYNIHCTALVEELLQQCSQCLQKFEIICIDDHSNEIFKKKNNTLKTLENVIYFELQENIGRARIRNLLAEKAQFENLLFLDVDSKIIRNDFVKKYIEYFKNNGVIYGGREYQKSLPDDGCKILHWKYGSQFEALKVRSRNKKPFLSFMSNNFLIKKDIFMKVQFDLNHKGYGYEDTLFAEDLRKRSVKIFHVDNPVEHTGLENSDIFLAKADEAMKNLALLYSSGKMPQTTLIKLHLFLKKIRLDGITSLIINQLLPLIDRNLNSKNPCMIFFQLYKYNRFWNYLKGEKVKG